MITVNNKNDILSRSNTNLLRVLFEALVLIHHLYSAYTPFGAVIVSALGPIAVGGFIFLSGFGVGVSFIKKGDEYSKKLLKFRLPRTYAILLIVDLCYLALYLVTGGRFNSPMTAIISVLYLPVFQGFVPLSHWIYFLADLIIYYSLFLLFAFIFKKARKRLLWTAIAILILDLIIITVLSGINYQTGSARYLRACLCFPIGLICASFSEKIASTVKKHNVFIAIGLAAASIVTAVFNYKPLNEYVLPIFAALALAVMLCRVNIKSRAVDHLSGLVIYVYVSHEFFLLLFRYLFSRLNIVLPANIIGFLIFVSTMLFAFFLNAIISKNTRIPRRR